MCYLITVAISKDSATPLKDAVRSIEIDYLGKVGIGSYHNPSVSEHLPENMKAFVILDRVTHCSCSLYGAIEGKIDETSYRIRIEQEIRQKYEHEKYRKWSKSKIERAVASALKNKLGRRNCDFLGLHPKIREALKNLVEEFQQIYLIVHNFFGSFSDEAVQINVRRTITTRQLLEEMDAVPEDVLIKVRNQATCTS